MTKKYSLISLIFAATIFLTPTANKAIELPKQLHTTSTTEINQQPQLESHEFTVGGLTPEQMRTFKEEVSNSPKKAWDFITLQNKGLLLRDNLIEAQNKELIAANNRIRKQDKTINDQRKIIGFLTITGFIACVIFWPCKA